MCKSTTLLKNVIFKHLSDMFPTETSRRQALKYPKVFNVEHLTEIALAKVGGYEFVDAEGYDFSDFSDSKTTSTNPNTNVVTISSIENKIGALRITCYNHVKQALDYFFVPSNKLHTVALACYGKNSHKQRIIARYTEAGDHYNQFEKFRIADFVTLAQTKG